jgi:hypothetical protein
MGAPHLDSEMWDSVIIRKGGKPQAPPYPTG